MEHFLLNPFSNGFLTFTVGIMFILTVYHWLLYFQHKDKLYLLYGFYTFFIILSHLHFSENDFLAVLLEPVGKVKYYGELYTETYYIIYFFFAFKFLDVRLEFPRWTGYLYKAVYGLAVFCILKFIIYLIAEEIEEVLLLKMLLKFLIN